MSITQTPRYNGIEVYGERPEGMINAYEGRSAIILASAECVWKDFEQAQKVMPKSDIICVNLTFIAFEWLMRNNKIHIEHWISLHPEMFQLRDIYFKDMGPKTHSKKNHRYVDHVWHIAREGGGGLFAVRIALLLGYKKIILCGMPMDNSRRFYDYQNMPNTGCFFTDHAMQLSWKCFPAEIGPENVAKIRSISPGSFSERIFAGVDGTWLNT